MISWIQRTFQHHFRIVFGVILAIMVIPLIFIYRTGANGGGEREVAARNFFGINLASPDEQRRLMGDAQMSIELRFGPQGIEDQQIQTYALQRAASLHLADEWHLPPATSAQITAYIKSLRYFANESGQFDPNRYAAFRERLRAIPGYSEGDIARVLADDVRAEEADRLIGGPGYVLPGDVKTQLKIADTTWTVAAAVIDYKSFDPGIKPTEADLQRYFQANGFRYTVPPQVESGYVAFPAADYLRDVSVTEADERAAYDADPARFASAPAKPGIPALKPDFASARPNVEAALKLERAGKLAAKAAADFVYALYEGKIAAGAPFDAWLAARNQTLKPLPPFIHDAPPAELGASPEVADAAFQLSAERYYSDALTIPGGAGVLIWKGILPAHPPLFSDVRAKVLADYLDGEKRQSFVEIGRAVKNTIEARLKAGDSFAQAAAAAAAASRVKITVKTPAPFSLRGRPADLDSAALSALEHLDKGQVSDMVAADEQGYIVCALDKKSPDLSETGPMYAQSRAQIAASVAQMDAGAVLGELVSEELKRGEPAAAK